MSILKEILEVTIYKIPIIENAMGDAFSKLTKELTCLNDESISIEVENNHFLAPISLNLIEIDTLMGEVIISKENLKSY